MKLDIQFEMNMLALAIPSLNLLADDFQLNESMVYKTANI